MYKVGQAVIATAENEDVPEGTPGIITDVYPDGIVSYVVEYTVKFELSAYKEEVKAIEEMEDQDNG
ncbi:MAG TPA: hypothetical protein GXX75_06990 [Clostridiales bacterium]|nr:hypothetical protein [Clostridiales bacterium]